MRAWLRLASVADRVSEALGALASWLVLAMVLLGAGNAALRWLGYQLGTNLTRNAFLEAQWYLFAACFLLAAPWALKHDAHVRVDVLHARLSARARLWVDAVGAVLFLVPFCVFGIWASLPAVAASWSILEGSPDPGGLPRFPIKTLVPLAFGLLLLQGLAELGRRIERLRGGEGA